MVRTVGLALGVIWLAGCGLLPLPSGEVAHPLVCIQITEDQDADAFQKVMSELQARGIKCAVLVDADFATENCASIKALADDGYEIMAFVRPDAPGGELVTLSMLSHEEQEQLITGVKTAIEDCLGEGIRGFRCYRFDQNEDTYAIVDALGFDFNLGFVARTDSCLPGHEDDSLPYQSPEYKFWAVPMHSVCTDGRCSAFCDMPFSNLEAEEWEALLISEFDALAAQDEPLLVEFHPYFTGIDEGRFEAFVSFLDHAVENGARFLTVAELVQQTRPENSSTCPCDE